MGEHGTNAHCRPTSDCTPYSQHWRMCEDPRPNLVQDRRRLLHFRFINYTNDGWTIHVPATALYHERRPQAQERTRVERVCYAPFTITSPPLSREPCSGRVHPLMSGSSYTALIWSEERRRPTSIYHIPQKYTLADSTLSVPEVHVINIIVSCFTL